MRQAQPWIPTAILALALFLGTGAFLPAMAQEEATPVPETEEAVPQIPEEHASPRATMRTFLEAFYAEGGADLTTAAACLDMTHLPFGPGSVKADELAVKLKQVIDRIGYVDYEKISDEPEGMEHVFLRQAEGQVVIARSDTGEWLFDQETVNQLDTLHRVFEDKEVVEGVAVEAPTAVSPATWLRSKVPASLRKPAWLLEGWQWIGLLAVILLGVIIGRIFISGTQGSVLRLMQRDDQSIDTKIVTRAIKPAGALVMVLVWGVGLIILGLPVTVLSIYYRAVWIVGSLAAVFTAYRVVDVVAELLGRRAAGTESRFDDLLVPLIQKSLKVFVVAVGVIVVAQHAGANVTGIIAGLGLGGLAFALAAQDTVSNWFGSLTVLLDRPFQVGDWIVTSDVEGTVEEVGFRSTRIRTFYNSLITLPNSNLTKASVDNYGLRAYRRWTTKIAITYDTPPERIDAFCEAIRELVRRHPYTRKDYFHVYLNEFGEASLQILLYVFFVTPDWSTELRERHRLAVDIIRVAKKLGVELAFPTQTLFVRTQEYQEPAWSQGGYAEGTKQLTDQAREQARHLVDEVLHGEVPPPVASEVPPEENRGS